MLLYSYTYFCSGSEHEKLRRQHEGEQNGTIGGTSMILVTPTSK